MDIPVIFLSGYLAVSDPQIEEEKYQDEQTKE
jgi:hypothetical protein